MKIDEAASIIKINKLRLQAIIDDMVLGNLVKING